MSFIVKNTTLINPLDLIAPHSCRGCGSLGDPLCKCCKNYIINNHINICPNCKTKIKQNKCPNCKNLPPTYTIGFREGLLNKLIHDYKYQPTRALGKTFAHLLDSILPDINDAILIPLPTATNHIRSRGFDHTYLIAKHLARLRKYKVKKLLLRTKNTVQVGSDKKTRFLQAENAFTINHAIKPSHQSTYILFDDVWTTGASMKTAIKKLKEANIKNIVVVLLAVSRI